MNLIQVLMLCAISNRVVHACPHRCSCSGSEVECSDVSNMTSFPVDSLPSNTTVLSIWSTQISSLEAGHFKAVPLLNRLQLYASMLDKLPSDLLRNASQLNSLDLTGNRLIRLPLGVFRQKSLRDLVLKNNCIEEAEAGWFDENNSLTQLDLSGNRLSDIPVSFLQKLQHLENLDLSDNKLEALRPDALKNLHHLDVLNLSGNKLSALMPTTFSHNPKLSRLFLQENQLRNLPPPLLSGLRQLQLLLLNQNRLRHLPTGLLDDRDSSFQLILATNPWLCDGKMEYLWRWLNEHPQSVIYPEEVICDGPEALRNRQVASLTESELGLVR